MKSFCSLVGCLLCLTGLLAREEDPPRQPNVLFVAVDDMRVELGCYGQKQIISPNIDALAKQGTLFRRAYCQQAVCNPSRASLMTGLRPATLGIWDLPTHFRQKFPDIVTLPQLFKNNGYFTLNTGKIYHNWRQVEYKGDEPSWSVPASMHYNSHANDKPQVKGKMPPNLSDIPKCEIRDVPDDAYFDGQIATLAIKTFQELKTKNQPFFHAVGFWKPHAHFNAPKKYWDLYRREDIQPPPNPDPPRDVPAIALHNGREICRDFTSRPDGRPNATDTLALRHGYYANISYVDAQVGRVIRELDRLKLRSRTIIVFWSDHGFHLGENSLWAKTSNFELDARVPLIIVSPFHKAGQQTDALVELLDLYPTLSELCGLRAPDHVEGVSLVPLLEDPGASVKNAAHTWHPRPAYPDPKKGPDAMGYSMRTARYRYTEWRDHKTGRVLATELYDHQGDPRETVNLAGRRALAGTMKHLARVLAETHPPVRPDRSGPSGQ